MSLRRSCAELGLGSEAHYFTFACFAYAGGSAEHVSLDFETLSPRGLLGVLDRPFGEVQDRRQKSSTAVVVLATVLCPRGSRRRDPA